MDKMAEKEVKECCPCQIVEENAPSEEFRNTPLPDKNSCVEVDLRNVSEGKLIDYHSGYQRQLICKARMQNA